MTTKHTPSLGYWFGKIEDEDREMIEIRGPEGRTLTVTAEHCWRATMATDGIPNPAEAIRVAREALAQIAHPDVEGGPDRTDMVLLARRALKALNGGGK